MAAMEEEAQIPHGDDNTTCAQSEGGLAEKYTDKNSQLYQACIEGSIELVKDLVHRGADVNACSAFDLGQDADIKLGGYGKDIDREEWDRPLFRAVWHGHIDVVEFLAKNGAHYVKKCPVLFISPLNKGYEHFADLPRNNQCYVWGSLLEAAVNYCSSAVNFLFYFYGSDITVEDTVISFAAAVKCGDVRKAREVVEEESLCASIFEGKLEGHEESDRVHRLTQVLFNGSQPSDDALCLLVLDRFGSMMVTGPTGGKRAVKLLTVSISNGLTATAERLMQLLTGSCRDISPEKCCSFSIGCNIYSCRAKKAGEIALKRGNLPILRSMAEASLLEVSQHRNALEWSICCSKYGADVYETLGWVVSRWALDLRGDCREGREAMHRAVKDQVQSLDALLRLGMDVNIRYSENRMTPAHLHLKHCVMIRDKCPSVEVLNALIRHGADLALQNREGYTALSHLFWLAQLLRNELERRAVINPRFIQSSAIDDVALVLDSDDEDAVPFKAVSFDPDSDSEDEEDSPFTFLHMDTDSESEEDEDPPLPKLLRPENPVRPFLERLAGKFGLGLLSMGADTLFGPQHWPRMESYLERAAIPWKHVPSLQTSCWTVIRRSVGGQDFQASVNQLPLPEHMKEFLIAL